MELIDKKDLINKIKDSLCKGCKSYHGIRCRACYIDDCLSEIDDALVIDAVPVVRCKDCKHSLENNGLLVIGSRYCHRNIDGNDVYEPVWDCDFCSKAERKEVQE